ncbi:DNA gyrase/topoisomerase IV subunit A [Clostridium rectalis]|uniref:DNA gyrase/topoisomerase IV subunit A n=1 Tax=Clostridium rectalis TaxID=2040295 RepID=UPI000F6434FD|nr:DNA topoisomerase (ATP-hydrolyzing) subunit A [Clostridium rectalis]
MIVQSDLDKALTEYYMPYAMKVITDRALPDVKDGLKPIARRILWTLWKNGSKYNTPKDKCGKIVGDVLKIHNHGDISAYLALALLTEQNESLICPFIDGGGAFGKIYSKDKPSAMRYTSARLNEFSEEMFKDINKNIVKFIGEDKDHMQPLFLSNTFPNILIKPNSGVAVGEACNWCSFNLIEVCNLTQAYIKNKDIKVIDYLPSPDFTTGSYIITNSNNLEKIYSTGKGSFKLQAKYEYNKKDNTIEVYEVPYNSTVEDIIKDVNGLISSGKMKDVSDIKDTTGYDKKNKKEVVGITIELKRNANPDKVMKILYKKTRLMTSFNCNFNCLVDYKPKVLGVKEVLDEWLKFRVDCIEKSLQYDISEKEKNLHFLKGLERVLLNIDKAIGIIRHSESDELIIDNLITEFNIDGKQANDISNMKLRNINQQYIIKRTKAINKIEQEIIKLKNTLDSKKAVNNIIIQDLEKVKIKYGKPRKTEILDTSDFQDITTEDLIEDNTVTLVLTKEGYLKKNLKYSESQKLKEQDEIIQMFQTTNKTDILLFTDKGNVLLRKTYELDECLPSSYGIFISNWLGEYLQEGEKIIYMATTKDYKGQVLTVFENGNVACTDLKKYKTKTNRQVPMDAYNTASKLIDIKVTTNDVDIFLLTDEGKALIVNTKKSEIRPTKSRDTKGVVGIRLKGDNKVIGAIIDCKEDNFTIYTKKGKKIDYMLDDVANNIEKSWKDYLTMKRGNQGNFMYNTRQKKDKIIKMELRE